MSETLNEVELPIDLMDACVNLIKEKFTDLGGILVYTTRHDGMCSKFTLCYETPEIDIDCARIHSSNLPIDIRNKYSHISLIEFECDKSVRFYNSDNFVYCLFYNFTCVHVESTKKTSITKIKDEEESNAMDTVNHPSHYKMIGGFESFDLIVEALGIDGARYFCQGNILKYQTRANHKNGEEDLKKRHWYSRMDQLLSECKAINDYYEKKKGF